MRIAALLLVVCGCAHGATREWMNPLGGSLADGANWTGSGPLGPSDLVIFDIGHAAYTVTGSSSIATERLIFGDDRVTMDLGGAQWDLSNLGGSVFNHALSIGDLPGLSGGLTIVSGGITADHAYVGLSIDAEGLLAVEGANSAATIDSQLFVGFAGRGEIGVRDGAMLHAGRLVGAAQTASEVVIDVDGAGSALIVTGDLGLGRQGPASMRITGGGLAQVGRLDAAARPGSVASIDVLDAGSSLFVDGQLTIAGERNGGTGGSASMRIGDLAQVDCSDAAVGSSFPAVGDVLVEGQGALRADNTIVIGPLVNPVGGPGGTGSVRLTGGATLEAALVHVGAGGSLSGEGTVVADVETVGLLSPGDGVGALTIDGSVTTLPPVDAQRQSVMRFEIGGEIAGVDHDQLVVTGAIALGSRLEATLVDGFVPRVGQTFTVITAESIGGGFTRFELPQQPPDWRIRTLEFSDRIVLEVVEGALPGDANGDGSVDFTDLNLVLSQFGQSGPNLEGDVNFNGSVDFTDLNFVLTSFGS